MRNDQEPEFSFWKRCCLTAAFALLAYGLTWLLAVKLARAQVNYVLYAMVIGVSIGGFWDGLRGKSRLGWAGATILLVMLVANCVRHQAPVPLSRMVFITAALVAVPLAADGIGWLVRNKLRPNRPELRTHNL